MPKLKYFLFFFASIVAFSRVVNGAHFFTDILGGMIVAIIVFKTLNLFFYKKNVTHPIMGITFLSNNMIFNSLFFLFICSVFVTVAPFVDLYLAGLFLEKIVSMVMLLCYKALIWHLFFLEIYCCRA